MDIVYNFCFWTMRTVNSLVDVSSGKRKSLESDICHGHFWCGHDYDDDEYRSNISIWNKFFSCFKIRAIYPCIGWGNNIFMWNVNSISWFMISNESASKYVEGA